MDFSKKVIIITGASSGIGAGAAEYFSALNASVVITGRNEEKLMKTAGKCKGETLFLVADMNLEADREIIINETIKKFGKIDVLVNNAGIGEAGDIMTTTMKQFDDVMNTNVRSVFHLTQLAVPHLIESRGNIVNVSSVGGLRAFTGFTAYCMSKSALDQFTRCVALELAPKGVRVNAVNPATIITNFQRRLGMEEQVYQDYLKKAEKLHALGRVGTVDDTAKAIAFLASNDLSAFVTGTLLAVDGGRASMCQQ